MCFGIFGAIFGIFEFCFRFLEFSFKFFDFIILIWLICLIYFNVFSVALECNLKDQIWVSRRNILLQNLGQIRLSLGPPHFTVCWTLGPYRNISVFSINTEICPLRWHSMWLNFNWFTIFSCWVNDVGITPSSLSLECVVVSNLHETIWVCETHFFEVTSGIAGFGTWFQFVVSSKRIRIFTIDG